MWEDEGRERFSAGVGDKQGGQALISSWLIEAFFTVPWMQHTRAWHWEKGLGRSDPWLLPAADMQSLFPAHRKVKLLFFRERVGQCKQKIPRIPSCAPLLPPKLRIMHAGCAARKSTASASGTSILAKSSCISANFLTWGPFWWHKCCKSVKDFPINHFSFWVFLPYYKNKWEDFIFRSIFRKVFAGRESDNNNQVTARDL